MEDSFEDNLTTRSLLKGILATEQVRTAVKQKSKKRDKPRPSASYVYQDENSSSPSMNLRSKMRERVQRSLGKSALEASVLKRKVETNSRTQKSKSAKKGSSIMKELDEITPSTLLKKIIQNQDEVSMIISQRPKAAAVDKKQENTPTAKLSSGGSVNLSLPDLQEAEHVTVFRKARQKRKMRVSEFEREVDERLPKNKDNISHDNFDVPALLANSYTMSGSIGNKPNTSAAPESTFKKGLLRRRNKMPLVSIDDFEQGVEDKYQLLKGSQKCFIESTVEDKSDSSSNEVAEKNTELYAQSLRKDANASKSDRKQRGASKLFASTFDEMKEANGEFMNTEIRRLNANVHHRLNAQRPEDNTKKDLGGDHGEVGDDSKDEAGDTAVEAGDEAVEAKTDDDAVEAETDDDAGDDAVEAETDDDAGNDAGDDAVEAETDDDAGSDAGDDAVEAETDDDPVEAETDDDAVEGEAVDSVEGEADDDSVEGEAVVDSVEGEADDDSVETGDDAADDDAVEGEASVDSVEGEADDDFMDVEGNMQQNKSSTSNSHRKSTGINKSSHNMQHTRLSKENGMQAAESIHLHTISVSRPDESSESSGSGDDENMDIVQNAVDRGMAKKKENNQLMLSALPETPPYIKSARFGSTDKPSITKKIQRTKSTKPKNPRSVLTSSQVKQIFTHHTQVRVSKEALADVEKCLDLYMNQLAIDLSTYTAHARRKTITRADMELLMKRQRLVTDNTSLNVLIEKHLPLDCRALLIPCATSGNKVFPKNVTS